MKKFIAMLLVGAMLLAGCGGKSSETESASQDQTGGETVVEEMRQDEFHGIRYEIPASWTKETQADTDEVYYTPAGENEEDIVIMLLYTDFTNKGVFTVYTVREIYEKMIEGLTNTDGITELTEDYRDLNGSPVGIAKYVQTSDADIFSASQYFFALPEQEGLFTCGYVVRKGVDDIYQDKYQALLNSIQLPASAQAADAAQAADGAQAADAEQAADGAQAVDSATDQAA